MRRVRPEISLLPLALFLLAGCSAIGDKSASISMIYAITAVLSLLLLALYCATAKKREVWHLLLFTSILVVNAGYYALAVSDNLEQALLANRLAYLGSVFLPLSMCMIILKVTHIRYRKWLPAALLCLGFVVFLIAASPGYLTVYYQEVTFQKLNGVTVLNKVYGPLHGIYLLYLLGYFAAMIAAIIHATLKDTVDSIVHATILAVAVFVNIGVWMIEQLVRIDFEILSVSYIISGSFLLGLDWLIAENEKRNARKLSEQVPVSPAVAPPMPAEEATQEQQERISVFLGGLPLLTPKETELYNCYVSGMTTDVIMEKLCIKENTLKFHSKNLYSKLGVKSRKQLMELHRITSAGVPQP